jgi:hypothetical protein
MVLDKKDRKLAVLLPLSALIITILALYVATITGNQSFDLNAKDIYLFQEEYTSIFRYGNGTKGSESTLTLQTSRLNQTHSNITLSYGNEVTSFLAHPNGTVYQNGNTQGNYSLWWIYIPNFLIVLGIGPGDSYDVVDPTGFLGTPDKAYLLEIESKVTYWPVDPELRDLLGAQSSAIARLWDKTNNNLVSTITFDMTCGHIEILEGSQVNNVKLTLISTDFANSRHRIFIFTVYIISCIIITILSYFAMTIKWKNDKLAKFIREKDQKSEIMLLLIMGGLAIGLEFVDIWFYLPLGMFGCLGIHLLYTILVAIVCKKKNYGLFCIIPSLLEVGFVFSLNLLTGDPYVPPLTAFMGSLCSWLIAVNVSGLEKIN